ncbi:MAG: hypothetical protein AAGA64_03920 [Bacteroidota bacterium]
MSELRKANTDATYFLTFTVVGGRSIIIYGENQSVPNSNRIDGNIAIMDVLDDGSTSVRETWPALARAQREHLQTIELLK